MPRVTGPDGCDLGEITDPGQLYYYRREDGYVVDDEPETVAVEEPVDEPTDEPAKKTSTRKPHSTK